MLAGVLATASSLFVLGCGGGTSAATDNCPDLAASYSVTTEIVSTTCPLGLHVITQPITWTFTQTAPSCAFTMTSTLYDGSVYRGSFAMQGSQASITWSSVEPPPTVSGYSLMYNSENLTLTQGVAATPASIAGSFVWSVARPCSGTTNVCHGSVPAGCLTPE